MTNKAPTVIGWILKLGLLAVPVLPLLITRSLFFPFITGKNFAFRILIEILVVLWVWLMLTDRQWRPRASIIFWAVTATFVILFLATVFSIWPQKAFWSNFERMEGLWAHLHYFLFFLMLGSVFKERRDWHWFFGISLGVSVVESFYGILQLLGKLEIHQGGVRLDGTMGNATYLAIYLVFHVFLFAYFFFQVQKRWLKIAFVAAILLELFVVYHTATRGAIFGVLAGLLVFALVNVLWSKGRTRQIALALLTLVIILPAVFIGLKEARFVQESEVLSRFANISLTETTTQSRFIIWGMAVDAWKERPVLGWGPESFVYLFSKEYKPELWRQEPWFDRAHNVFLDWLTSAGILGLLAYLSIFVGGLVILFKLARSNIFKREEAAVFAGLFTAYFVHNLFVFDNFTSYMLFFSIAAFIHWQYINSRKLSVNEKPSGGRSTFLRPVAAGLVAVLVFVSVYTFNVKPIRAAGSIIDTLRLVTYSRSGTRERDINAGLETVQKALALNTFGTTEIREQFAQYAQRIYRDTNTGSEDRIKFLNFAIAEMEKQVVGAPYDVRAKVFLVTLYTEAGRLEEALQVGRDLLAVSPQRQQFYFLLGEVFFKAGDEERALEAMKRAYELAPEYPEAIHNYAIIAIFAGRAEFAEELLEKHFGTSVFPDRRYVNAYGAIGDLKKLTLVWEALVVAEPTNFGYRLGLTSIYLKTFADAKAIAQLQKAIELDPNFKAQGEFLIQQIRDGTIQR